MQLITTLKGKIHRATVTDSNIEYIGSITIDEDLMIRAGIKKWELVRVWNITNGNRWETYVIPAPKRSGVICINGAAAHLASKGDKVIIAAFVTTDEDVTPRLVLVDEDNMFLRNL